MIQADLSGYVAAVTGASSGFGQAISKTLGRAGAHVFMCGRTAGALEATRAEIEEAGGEASIATFDIRDLDALNKFVRDAGALKGRLDIMVNNAGLGYNKPITEGNPDEWREMLEVNVLSLLQGCKSAVEVMRETKSEGRIINISSTSTLRRDSGVYGATKYAVNNINSTLRQELEDDTIRVTAIKPGVFVTNFVRNLQPEMVKGMMEMVGMGDVQPDNEGKFSSNVLQEFQKKMGNIAGDPQAVADVVLYVASLPVSVNVEELVIRPPKSMTI
ncbi:MAG: SDR family oxidoreductase [Alphaproteobacteria bacterium]|nr:MAG: SDR family oxidoreductase [Alphaproteobacteria bacterium]